MKTYDLALPGSIRLSLLALHFLENGRKPWRIVDRLPELTVALPQLCLQRRVGQHLQSDRFRVVFDPAARALPLGLLRLRVRLRLAELCMLALSALWALLPTGAGLRIPSCVHHQHVIVLHVALLERKGRISEESAVIVQMLRGGRGGGHLGGNEGLEVGEGDGFGNIELHDVGVVRVAGGNGRDVETPGFIFQSL